MEKLDMQIKSYKDYMKAADANIEKFGDIRRQLIAQCKQIYNYIESAYDRAALDTNYESEIERVSLYSPDDPKYADWSDNLSDREFDVLFDKYEQESEAFNEVADILDNIDEIQRLIEQVERNLSWVEGE